MSYLERPCPPLSQVDQLVEMAACAHGHLCPGQVIGVRMSILGLGLLGYECPPGYPGIKNLLGIVEIERCLADAVGTATGLRMGRGSLKLINLGLLAATFMDLSTGRAVRLHSREDSRELAQDYAQGFNGPHATQTAAYRIMPDEELFEVAWVKVNLDPGDLPGARPLKVPCSRCGAVVRSGQTRPGTLGPLCRVCAGESYFTFSSEENH